MSLRPLRGSLANWTPKAGTPKEPVHALAAAWPAIVGLDVAANSAPVTISGDALVVATRSSAWSQQLQMLSPAILAGIAAQGVGAELRRVSFRSGAFRAPESRGRAAGGRPRVARAGDAGAYEPAADLGDAFERVRRRIRAARRATDATCVTCGAPLETGSGARDCTPCALAADAERALALERLLFAAPWLALPDVREQLPQTTPAAYERARRRLLQRWWLALERARVAGGARAGAFERALASSYVLLQSRLPPDRVTPAIVRNLLGEELATAIFGERAKS